MKCPYCTYEHGRNNETHALVTGPKGEFFCLPVVLEREDPDPGHLVGTGADGIERKALYGCPECGKTFIAL